MEVRGHLIRSTDLIDLRRKQHFPRYVFGKVLNKINYFEFQTIFFFQIKVRSFISQLYFFAIF